MQSTNEVLLLSAMKRVWHSLLEIHHDMSEGQDPSAESEKIQRLVGLAEGLLLGLDPTFDPNEVSDAEEEEDEDDQ